jgi:Flp pilus assembly pilin Flp
MTFLRRFWKEEQGQNLMEYTLLLAFVVPAAATLFLGAGRRIKGIWTDISTHPSGANGNPSSG